MKLKCYISSSFGTNTAIIESVLHQLNVDLVPNIFSSNTTGVFDQIKQKLGKSDFVIGAINDIENPNVFFELGFAKALNLPLIIIIPKTFESIPLLLHDTILLRCGLDEYEPIFYNIQQFVNFLHEKQLIDLGIPEENAKLILKDAAEITKILS